MAVINDTLFNLIKTNVDANMAALNWRGRGGHHPLNQRNPMYYIEMCKAFAYGIGQGTPEVDFRTDDTGVEGNPPETTGVGAGVGIIVEEQPMEQFIYTYARTFIIEQFQKTMIDPYPPRATNYGIWLLAICRGVSQSVKTHFATCWTLTSANTPIYRGTGLINDSYYSGIIVDDVHADILSNAPNFHGRFWPYLAQAVAQGYADGIQLNSTGTVAITGTCVPTMSLVCEVPGTGHGTGVAT